MQIKKIDNKIKHALVNITFNKLNLDPLGHFLQM